MAFLDVVADTWPGKTIYIILDKLSTHKTLVRFLFQPTYAPWLNLIEPWWKTLRALAVKGRCFQIGDEIVDAIKWATNHWNQNKKPYVWRKAFT